MSFFRKLRWIDGRPLLLEPYRQRIFERFFDERREDGTLRYNFGLFGRGKKNNKTLDMGLGALWALLEPTPGQHEVLLVAFDEDQGKNALDLLKLIIKANPVLEKLLTVRENIIYRNDGRGYIKVLPGQSAAGEHGRTFRFLGVDEIHNQRTWDLLEALQPDPFRTNAQIWITSYASLFHRPGVPLYDLTQIGRSGRDPRMLFSWYAADYCSDPDFAELEPKLRANPSIGSWPEGMGYLEQQERRLPAHKFRRLHLNLPGLPEGSAYQPEPVMNAFARGLTIRPPEYGLVYQAFVDMSGGSSDDAVLSIGHTDLAERAIVDRVVSQGQQPPFDPSKAVTRFVAILREYGITSVTGDKYAGETFRVQFDAQGIAYRVSDKTKSQLYESLEPHVNGQRVVLPDVSELEQQLLGLVWRGGKIDHQAGEHDDYANAVAGCVVNLLAAKDTRCFYCQQTDCSGFHVMGDELPPREEVYDAQLDKFDLDELSEDDRGKYGDRQVMKSIGREGFWFPGD